MPENAAILRHGNRHNFRQRRRHENGHGRLLGQPFAGNGASGHALAAIEPLEGGGAVLAELARTVEHDLSMPDHAPATEGAYAHDWADLAAFCGRHTARAAPDGRSQTLALDLKALETQRSRSPTGPRGRDHRTLAVDGTLATHRERVATGRGPRRRGPKRSSYRLHGVSNDRTSPDVARHSRFRASRPRPRLLRSRSGGQLARLDVCGIGAPKQHASPIRRRGRRSGSWPQRHSDGGASATQPLSGGLVVRPVGLSLPTLRRWLATIASRHALALRRRRSTHLSAPPPSLLLAYHDGSFFAECSRRQSVSGLLAVDA